MKVRLISHSTPDNIIGVDDAQELIAYCANKKIIFLIFKGSYRTNVLINPCRNNIYK